MYRSPEQVTLISPLGHLRESGAAAIQPVMWLLMRGAPKVEGPSLLGHSSVLQEHIAIKETLEQTRAFTEGSARLRQFDRQIQDLGEERLETMDRTGIEFEIRTAKATFGR